MNQTWERILNIKLTGSTNSSGVSFKAPQNEVIAIVEATMCRTGLRRITIEWDDLPEPELQASERPELEPSSQIKDMVNEAVLDEIPGRIDSATGDHLHDTPPHSTIKIDTIVEESHEEITQIEEGHDNSTIHTAPPLNIPSEPPSMSSEPDPSDNHPFKEIDRISQRELKEVKQTDNPDLVFYPVGDGRISIKYRGSKVDTTWVAIKGLPDNIPDEKLRLLNGPKAKAVRELKAWMIRRKQ